jgi:amino acid adenylation domain-containing protein
VAKEQRYHRGGNNRDMSVAAIITSLKQYNVVPRAEGDRLTLHGEVHNLPPELLQAVKDEKPALLAYLQQAARQMEGSAIPTVPQQPFYPVSNAQNRIWVLSQFDGGSAAYNITASFATLGPVNLPLLQRALDAVVARHESLRTVFSETNGEPVQVVLDTVAVPIAFVEGQTALSAIETAGAHPFDLANGPLLKLWLHHLADGSHLLILVMHHIISDGWSVAVVMKELQQHYAAYNQGQAPLATPLAIQYKDYSHWLSQELLGERAQAAQRFWQAELEPPVEPLQLPLSFARPAVQSFEGAAVKYYFSDECYARITAFCAQQQVTLFNFLRTTASILLSKWCGQSTIVLGTPVAGRNHGLLHNQVGLYINTLPLKTTVDSGQPFDQLLQSVSAHTARAFAHQDYPFDKMLEHAAVKRDSGSNPLFDVMLVLQDMAVQTAGQQDGGQGLALATGDAHWGEGVALRRASKLDITLNCSNDTNNRFYVELEYATALFTQERMAQLFRIWQYIIDQVLDNPQLTVGHIQTADAGERHKILQVFNRPVAPVETLGLHVLLAGAFDRYGTATALMGTDGQLTYAQLQQRSGQVARQLQPLLAANPTHFVGLLLGRSATMVTAIMGIVQAGGAYVPIDITYPLSRVSYIVEDAELQLLVVDDVGRAMVPDGFAGKVVHINELMQGGAAAIDTTVDRRQQTAYLIYTSGSTGQPKGVEITHQNATAFLQWCTDAFAQTGYETLYATTSYCFDLSVFEFFVPLLQGKAIRVLSSALEIPQYIGNDKKVMLNTVPSAVRSLLDGGMDWRNIAALNMAGEPIPKKIKAEIDYRAIEVRNLYGPSEDTTYSTVYRFENDAYPFIPIGTPVGYTQLYILDAQGHLQPEGVEGEIYLSGHSVAKGYYNRPGLTAERFLPNPFVPGLRMYRTGDVGKWLPDGQVAFSGRADDQVKVRGYRIEPGEIEFLLEQHPRVEQAVVAIKPINGTHEMVAYWMGSDAPEAAELRPWLATQVPVWMVPAHWVKMEAIPLNSNGKTDKARLPMPLTGASIETVLPQTETEQTFLQLWQQVLPQAGNLGVTDNFFYVGGNSLHAVKLRALIAGATGKELSLTELFQHPTIRQQAELTTAKPSVTAPTIPATAPQATYPLSHAQQRLWVLANFEAASRAYQMRAIFRIGGTVDAQLLETAFNVVVEHHEALRTVFVLQDGQPLQKILPPADARLHIARFDTATQTDTALEQWILQHDTAPFDLQQGPLIRCWLLQTAEGQVLYCNMHHIISDGWSVVVLCQAIAAAYRQLAAGQQPTLPALDIQYKDFAVWQQQQLSGENMQGHQRFWEGLFADGLPVLELPTDHHRPDVKTYNGAVHRVLLKDGLTAALTRLAQSNGTSIYTVLMAGVNLLLKKYANQRNIVCGTTVAGRGLQQLEQQIGFYVNALPVRTVVEGDMPFVTLLAQQQATLAQVYEHQDYPFGRLVEQLGVQRNLSRSPLFDVMVVLQNLQGQEAVQHFGLGDGCYLERLPFHDGTAKYDLTFLFEPTATGLQLTLEYNTDLYGPAMAAQMARHLQRIFEQVTAQPQLPVKSIALPDAAEMELLLSKADNTQVGYDATATIVGLFGKAAAHYADNIALVVGDRQLTYQELDMKSGQLARILIQQHQVQTGDLVALHTGRSEWMLMAILAVLKAGAAYVPIDPAYPAERVAYILNDSAAQLVLYDEALPAALRQQYPVTYLDIAQLVYEGNMAQANIQPQHLAYVIYTSGTTGQPKGVLITHRNVARLLFTDTSLFDFDGADRWSLFHSYCFDFSVWEMYGALLYGGTLVMVPKEVAQDSIAFYDFLAEQQITVLNQTPTAFRSLVQQNKERFLQRPLYTRYLIFGGEALLPGLLKEWQYALPGCRNINMYGITETTVHVTYKEITLAEIEANKSNIGLPIPTLSCYVLDGDLQQVPVGVTGELCVGGAGVAMGYLNKPGLTAEKFIDNPYRHGEKMYRSGDYARILPNGELVYIGRRDDQVKIRGHRIETAEVEAALRQLPTVKDAVVLAITNAAGEHELAAYYIEAEAQQGSLRNSLAALLPAYMVPAYLIALPAFPLNSNGKLDKQALPAPAAAELSQAAYVPPRNDIDRQIVAIWQDVLEREQIGIADNFFDLGGHSLNATRVIGRIQEHYNVKIDLKEIFTEPTIAHLSNYVEMALWAAANETVNADGGEKMVF